MGRLSNLAIPTPTVTLVDVSRRCRRNVLLVSLRRRRKLTHLDLASSAFHGGAQGAGNRPVAMLFDYLATSLGFVTRGFYILQDMGADAAMRFACRLSLKAMHNQMDITCASR